jgi:hypothetical protein
MGSELVVEALSERELPQNVALSSSVGWSDTHSGVGLSRTTREEH